MMAEKPQRQNTTSEPKANHAPRLELYIPAHHPAPGERPDYGYVPRLPAGAVERPDITVPARQTHHLAYSLIRVLNDDGAAVGAWNHGAGWRR